MHVCMWACVFVCVCTFVWLKIEDIRTSIDKIDESVTEIKKLYSTILSAPTSDQSECDSAFFASDPESHCTTIPKKLALCLLSVGLSIYFHRQNNSAVSSEGSWVDWLVWSLTWEKFQVSVPPCRCVRVFTFNPLSHFPLSQPLSCSLNLLFCQKHKTTLKPSPTRSRKQPTTPETNWRVRIFVYPDCCVIMACCAAKKQALLTPNVCVYRYWASAGVKHRRESLSRSTNTKITGQEFLLRSFLTLFACCHFCQ